MRVVVDDYKEFWKKDNLKSVAEGGLVQGDWNIPTYLQNLRKALSCKTILDFGCGRGRLADGFPISYYTGVDINPDAIKFCKENKPRYKFKEVDIDSEYPTADMVLVFTVFLHMDDKTLLDVLSRLANSAKKYLIIIETLGREWRSSHTVPVYNRDLNEYVEILGSVDFSLEFHHKQFNPRYGNDPRFQDRNCNTDVLIFKKEE